MTRLSSVPRPLEARLTVYLTFRNTGSKKGKVTALPVRRYNDGTTNRSILDAMTDMEVPAHSTRSYFNRYDYNALEHELIECGVQLDLGDGLSVDSVPLRVLPPA